eukprot:CAMPEP_0184338756 /NCGR_PEP_ID=MMETSP1089-20130417/7355_1 /TAXON_ID=38269 ORGANISM="Gloeochaete wittrockiana, Strain SAG46.84" /NCGR_SAMPLE_ID=MMETSP1089 /ASSEMBLY_ACC=CAM_ASM_000445 /LENGTH=570 /DNA_ID=CAMNT_0026665507 /DNA_START=30 /DNA_END=1742 /DNA_ORIENTATION=-
MTLSNVPMNMNFGAPPGHANLGISPGLAAALTFPPCHDWQFTGACKLGNKCPFFHDPKFAMDKAGQGGFGIGVNSISKPGDDAIFSKIMIRNLSSNMDEAQLRQIFSQFGKITDIKMPDRDAGPDGFAVIEFFSAAAAKDALRLDGMENYLDGKKIIVSKYDMTSVKPAAPPPPKKKEVKQEPLAASGSFFDVEGAKSVVRCLKEGQQFGECLDIVFQWISRGFVNSRNAEQFFQMLQNAFTRIPTFRSERTSRSEQVKFFALECEEWERSVEKERAERHKKGAELYKLDTEQTAKEEADLKRAREAFRAAQKQTGTVFNKKQKKQFRDWARKVEEIFEEFKADKEHPKTTAAESDDDAVTKEEEILSVKEEHAEIKSTEKRKTEDSDGKLHAAKKVKEETFSEPAVKNEHVRREPSWSEDVLVKSEISPPPAPLEPLLPAVRPPSPVLDDALVAAVDASTGPDGKPIDPTIIITCAAIFLSSNPLHGAQVSDITRHINRTLWAHSGQSHYTVRGKGVVGLGEGTYIGTGTVEKTLKSHPHIFSRSVKVTEGKGDTADSFVTLWKVLVLG